jgi:hypothetical protein
MNKKSYIGFMIFCLIFVWGSQWLPAEVGVKLGLSKVDVGFSQEIPGMEFSSRSEFIAGAYFSLNLFKTLTIQPEVYYVKKGANSTEGDEFSEWEFSYLEFPVLLKVKIPTKSRIKPGVFMGPYVAFNTKAKVFETEYGSTSERDLKDFAEKMDYGLVLGCSLEYKLGFGKLIFDARYNMGLVNVTKHLRILTEGALADDDYVKNRSFAIMIGFGF